jgi:hypothetical protein
LPVNTAAAIAEIESSAARLASIAEAQASEFIRGMQLSQSRMLSRYAQIIGEADIMSAPVKDKLIWYAQNIRSLDEVMLAEDVGYWDALQKYSQGYDEIMAQVESLLGAGGIGQSGFTQIHPDVISALKQTDLRYFSFLNEEAIIELHDDLLNTVLTSTSKRSMLQVLKGKITGEYPWGTRTGLYEWHAGTYSRTAHSGFARQVMGAQATQYGITQFYYAGPADSKSREFCLKTKDQGVYTREEIDALDNGQFGMVFDFGGGYNCRHSWVPISQETATAFLEQMAA